MKIDDSAGLGVCSGLGAEICIGVDIVVNISKV